jgi:hypothetical protein
LTTCHRSTFVPHLKGERDAFQLGLVLAHHPGAIDGCVLANRGSPSHDRPQHRCDGSSHSNWSSKPIRGRDDRGGEPFSRANDFGDDSDRRDNTNDRGDERHDDVASIRD